MFVDGDFSRICFHPLSMNVAAWGKVGPRTFASEEQGEKCYIITQGVKRKRSNNLSGTDRRANWDYHETGYVTHQPKVPRYLLPR